MKQKGQAKQNTKKELKETLNWTSSEETVAPDAPVTLNQSNRLASDTPVLYDRCNGPSKCPGHGLVQSSTGYTGGTNLWHLCKHHVMHQRACQAAEEKFFSTGYTGGHRSKAPMQHCDSCRREKLHRMHL